MTHVAVVFEIRYSRHGVKLRPLQYFGVLKPKGVMLRVSGGSPHRCGLATRHSRGGSKVVQKARFLVLFPAFALLVLMGTSPLGGQEGEETRHAMGFLNPDGTTELVQLTGRAEALSESAPSTLVGETPGDALLRLVNQERISRGIRPLMISSELTDSAQFHSNWMVQHDCVAVQCPGEPDLRTRIESAGYVNYRTFAENVAAGCFYSIPSGPVGAWMSLAGARDNLLNPSFREAGVGYAYDGATDYRYYWTLDLGARKGLRVSHIEVTQAIQDGSNSVPLIAGKPAFVRVYVDCDAGCTAVPDVTGLLRGYGPSGELADSPRSPVSRFITGKDEAWTDQRGELQKTLNFTLPPGWAAGTVTLVAEVSSEVSSHAFAQAATFRQARTKHIAYLPVRWDGQQPSSRIDNGAYWARRVWPTADMNYIPWPTMEWSPPVACARFLLHPEYYDDYVDCLSDDLKNRLTERYRQGHVGGYIFGWLAEGVQMGVGGSSDPTWYGGAGKAAFGLDHPTEGPRTFAHELGHLMGRRHTNTGQCGDLDPQTDWPYSSARIQDYGIDGYSFAWLLSASSAVKNPGDTYDYMSYCGSLAGSTVWTSPWTYEHLYTEALQLGLAGLEAGLLSSPEDYFISSGLVYTDDTATLDPIWVISSTLTPENPPAGTQYCLEAQDSSDLVLVSQCFDLAFMNYETGEATDVDGFSLMLPYPSGVARIVLMKGTTELAVKPVSANAPVVTVVSPNGGETWAAADTYDITWSATDADGDSLSYSVMYSQDGSDWIPVGGTVTEMQVTVSSGELPGSDMARVRVLASDGVNTSEDQSDDVFTVGRKPPWVSIMSPEDSAILLPGRPILLQGYAYDLEDGVLEGGSLDWSSDRDGPLGVGSPVLVILSPGDHTIKLTAEDSDGSAVSASVVVDGGDDTWLPLALKTQ